MTSGPNMSILIVDDLLLKPFPYAWKAHRTSESVCFELQGSTRSLVAIGIGIGLILFSALLVAVGGIPITSLYLWSQVAVAMALLSFALIRSSKPRRVLILTKEQSVVLTGFGWSGRRTSRHALLECWLEIRPIRIGRRYLSDQNGLILLFCTPQRIVMLCGNPRDSVVIEYFNSFLEGVNIDLKSSECEIITAEI